MPIAAEEPLPETIRFNRDIRPILSDTCFAYHGPDAKHRKAKLQLDVEENASSSAEGVTAIGPATWSTARGS